jgi:acetyl esterase/lipase
MTAWKRGVLCAGALSALAWPAAFAGPLRDRIVERRAAQEQGEVIGNDAAHAGSMSLPADSRIVRDVAYGKEGRQRFDVYVPARARGAPVIFMVHGGAWLVGDKAARSVVENKVARWLPRGFIVVSANYRMQPQAGPVEQARDVALALAAAQGRAAEWGGDRTKFILMGHSAGAHLVALLAASPALVAEFDAAPPLGVVLLDSAALDVVQIMEAKHPRFYDRAFGGDPDYWRSASPFHALAQPGAPVLAVCSSRRDDACPQARRFVAKAASLGMRASVLERDLSHQDVNQQLGREQAYTEAVESFLRTLGEPVAARLDR